MTLDDYVLTVFCLVDDQRTALHLDHVRRRGFAPLLHDSEVLTVDWSASSSASTKTPGCSVPTTPPARRAGT